MQIVSTLGSVDLWTSDRQAERADAGGRSVAKRNGRSLLSRVKDFLVVGFGHGGCIHHVHHDYVRYLRETTGHSTTASAKASVES